MRDENHGIIGASSPRQLTHTLPAQHQHAPYAWLPALVVVLALAAVVAGAVVFHYAETRLVENTGDSLAMSAADTDLSSFTRMSPRIHLANSLLKLSKR